MTAPRWTLANAGAVPGTGRHTLYKWFLRRPRNAATKRAIVGASGSMKGEKIPPSSWDDIKRRSQRTWKEHRRYRWKDTGP